MVPFHEKQGLMPRRKALRTFIHQDDLLYTNLEQYIHVSRINRDDIHFTSLYCGYLPREDGPAPYMSLTAAAQIQRSAASPSHMAMQPSFHRQTS